MKTQVIKQVTEEQVYMIDFLFDKVYFGLLTDEKKEEAIKSICNGRTGSPENLTFVEANILIKRLKVELKQVKSVKNVAIKPITEAQMNRIKELFNLTYPGEHSKMYRDYLIDFCSDGRTEVAENLTFDEAERAIDMLIYTIRHKNEVDDRERKEKQAKSNKKPVTPAQIKKIHVLLRENGLIDQKENMLYSISDGRTSSTKELTCNEAKRLIAFLMDDQAEIQNKQKVLAKAIWHLAWDMGIIYGETDDDYEMNKAKLNMFCRQRGTVKKNLTEQNLVELRKTHRQFEAMYAKHKNKVSK